jgi:hypothetical protein
MSSGNLSTQSLNKDFGFLSIVKVVVFNLELQKQDDALEKNSFRHKTNIAFFSCLN